MRHFVYTRAEEPSPERRDCPCGGTMSERNDLTRRTIWWCSTCGHTDPPPEKW